MNKKLRAIMVPLFLPVFLTCFAIVTNIPRRRRGEFMNDTITILLVFNLIYTGLYLLTFTESWVIMGFILYTDALWLACAAVMRGNTS